MFVGYFMGGGGELSRARQYCPILDRHILDTVSMWEETNHTYKEASILSCWNGGEAHHIINEPCLEEEDLFH